VKADRHARGVWIVAAAVVLVAGHGVILYYGSSQLELSAAIVSSVAILVIAKPHPCGSVSPPAAFCGSAGSNASINARQSAPCSRIHFFPVQ
jgi:hypothetical protein